MSRRPRLPRRPLERGDRVVLPGGATATLTITADAEGNALVRCDDPKLAPADRYVVVPVAKLVLG